MNTSIHPAVLLLLLLLALSGPTAITGFPDGAPSTACPTMTPVHSVRPQASRSPYRVTFTVPPGAGYDSVRQIEVNISSPTGATFKGFILTAKETSGTSLGQRVGSFATPRRSASSRLTCNNTAVTQSINRVRQHVSVIWIPPTRLAGPVTFTATVVESYSKFWVSVVSDPLEATARPRP